MKEFFLTAVTTFVILTITQFVQSQTLPRETTGAVVSGRVTTNGQPVKDCLVVISPGQNMDPLSQSIRRGKTDSEGNFRITNMPAGNYEIMVKAPGFFAMDKGVPASLSESLSIINSDPITNLNFEIIKGGVITGRIVNAENKPIIEMQVTLIQLGASSSFVQYRRPPQIEPTSTDDRGVFRFYGLPPGQYRVAAGAEQPIYAQSRGALYRRAYYPNASEEDKGKVLTLTDASEITGVDFTFGLPETTFSVSGKVVDENGNPVPNISYGVTILKEGKSIGGWGGNEVSNQRGEFTIERLPVGRYTLRIPGSQFSGSIPTHFGESEQFEVIDQDVKDIVVRATQTATVSGNVVLSDITDPKLIAKVRQLRFSLLSMSGKQGYAGRIQSFTVGPDGSFMVHGLSPGTLTLMVRDPTGFQSGFRVTKLERNGSQPVEVKAGDYLDGVQATLSYGSGGVSGVVKISGTTQTPALRGFAAVFRNNTSMGDSPMDSQGRFLINGLMPGTYRLRVMLNLPEIKLERGAVEQEVIVNDQTVSDVVIVFTPKEGSQ